MFVNAQTSATSGTDPLGGVLYKIAFTIHLEETPLDSTPYSLLIRTNAMKKLRFVSAPIKLAELVATSLLQYVINVGSVCKIRYIQGLLEFSLNEFCELENYVKTSMG